MPSELPKIFKAEIVDFCFQVSTLFAVPPTAVFLAKSVIPREYNLSCLEHLYCGAAPLGVEIEEAIKQRYFIVARQSNLSYWYCTNYTI